MIINGQTKIAALIKHHPDALEVIVSLSPDFKKLRNPVLRKLMAGRTSISMASKIGGCKPDDFFEKLRPLGFETDSSSQETEEVNTSQKPLSQFVHDIEKAHIVPLDVRAMLAGGDDPLRLIQQTVKGLPQGHVLKIINTFEPTPLIKLLEKQGFNTYVDVVEPDLIETYFYRTDSAHETSLGEGIKEDKTDWDNILERFAGKLEQLDVRNLEMPGPMMTILASLEKLDPQKALYVHHKRIPVFLLSELKDRNFEFRIKELSETEVHLIIFKD